MLQSLRTANPANEQRAGQILPWGDWGSGYAAGDVTYRGGSSQALQLLAVYGCCQLIADTIATMPNHVYRPTDDGPVEVPKPPWLEQPNQTTDQIEFFGQVLLSWLLEGNAFVSYGLNAAFGVSELVCLNPTDVELRTDNPNQRVPVAYVNGQPFRGNLKHVKAMTLPGCLRGLSPVEYQRQSINLGLGSQMYANQFLTNGAHLSGVIETDMGLSPEEAQDLKNKWARAHSGLAVAHMPGVLDNGATWKPISVTPEQAQFLQSRNFSDAQIAGQMFLVEPSMLGIGVQSASLTYANVEQRGIYFVQFTLMRWILRLERLLSKLLPASQYLKFNVASLERADLKTRYEAYRIANPTEPWISQDEIRDLEEFGPAPDDLTAPPPAPAFVPVPPSNNGATVGVSK